MAPSCADAEGHGLRERSADRNLSERGRFRSVSAYERLAVDAPPDAVVSALREALRSRAITEYAVVDHGRDMAAAGATGFVAWTLVFGNPAAGAKLLERELAAAVDIPLRLAVIAGESGGSEIVRRDMRSLLSDDLAGLADAFNEVLRALAEDARERATGAS
ncbi:MAG: hypothetical protein V7607_6279 [Solirubrobacteraceae bacterium]